MKRLTFSQWFSLGVIGAGFAVAIAYAPVARSDEIAAPQWEPPGFADVQREALWQVIAFDPRVGRVEQIVVLGSGATPVIDGWLMGWDRAARAWVVTPFSASFKRPCAEVVARCFHVVEFVVDGQFLIAATSKLPPPD